MTSDADTIEVTTSGNVPRSDRCATRRRLMLYRVDEQERVVTMFCGAVDLERAAWAWCPAALREIPIAE